MTYVTSISRKTMKRILLATVFTVLFANCLHAQNVQDSIVMSIRHDYALDYPTLSDKEIEDLSLHHTPRFTYPTLIINNLIISDDKMIVCFRNQFQDLIKEEKIRCKWVRCEKAKRMGIINASKDGAIFIKTKRNFYLDLTNCSFYERE